MKPALLTGAVLAGAVAATPVASQAPAFEPSRCPVAMPSGQVEGQSVECGYLVVPESRRRPSKRTLRLAVATFKNPSGITKPDPIVYLAGGPGGSSLEMIDRTFGGYSPALAASRDLILFDQRGVGVSQPALDCPGSALDLAGYAPGRSIAGWVEQVGQVGQGL